MNPVMSRSVKNPHAPYWVMMRGFERKLIENALRQAEGSISGAAQLLGMSRQFLSQRIKIVEVDPACLAHSQPARIKANKARDYSELAGITKTRHEAKLARDAAREDADENAASDAEENDAP